MAQVNAENSIRVFLNYHSTKAAKSHVLHGTFIQSTQKKHGQRRTDRADGQYDLPYLS
jgi:hypothetical protein